MRIHEIAVLSLLALPLLASCDSSGRSAGERGVLPPPAAGTGPQPAKSAADVQPVTTDSVAAPRAASSLQAEPVYDPEQARPMEPEMRPEYDPEQARPAELQMRAIEPEQVRPAELQMEAVQPQPRVEAMQPLPRPQPVQVQPSQPGGF